jgi:hypothetical protein
VFGVGSALDVEEDRERGVQRWKNFKSQQRRNFLVNQGFSGCKTIVPLLLMLLEAETGIV